MIRTYLQSHGYTLPNDKFAGRIEQFKQWMSGFVREFHEYTVRDATGKKRKYQRYRLGMAEIVASDMACLLLNEKVQITADGFDELPELLERNAFMDRGNELIEWTMALGTGALVEFLSADGEPLIDYIRGDMIYPLRWDNGEITECAFGSRCVLDGIDHKPCIGYYIQIHERDESGRYLIRNVYLDDSGRELTPPDGIESTSTSTDVPLFQIIKPKKTNVLAPDSPMGISLFGTAIDQLKGCDLVYDSYVNEFLLGKKRMYVPLSMAQLQMQSDGTMQPVFDPNDALIYVYQQDSDGKNELKPVDGAIRSSEHEAGLQRMLDLLSKKCGLGTGRYRFDSSGVKTATEVISENSDLYQSVKRNEKNVERAIVGMVRALACLTGHDGVNLDVNVVFDDSIFEDTGTTIDRNVTLTASGLRSKKRAIMEIEHCDEQTAADYVSEIGAESPVQMPQIDLLGGETM